MTGGTGTVLARTRATDEAWVALVERPDGARVLARWESGEALLVGARVVLTRRGDRWHLTPSPA